MPESIEENLYEVEELLVQPGTYFNPQTEVVVVVDDSASLDQEVFNMEAYEGADWVRISDAVPIDEDKRDQLLEKFQTHYHPGSAGLGLRDRAEQGDEEMDEDEAGQEVGREDRPVDAGRGRAAPDFTLPDQDGNEVILEQLPRGDRRPLLLSRPSKLNGSTSMMASSPTYIARRPWRS